MSTRRYPIKPQNDIFDAGLLPDGRQVLVGLQMPELVAIRFSPEGELIDVRVVEITTREGGTVFDHAAAALARWKTETGFQPRRSV